MEEFDGEEDLFLEYDKIPVFDCSVIKNDDDDTLTDDDRQAMLRLIQEIEDSPPCIFPQAVNNKTAQVPVKKRVSDATHNYNVIP